MWRAQFTANRRHPLALSAYCVIFLLGFLFLIGVFQSAVLDATIGAEWREAWQWLLTLGGGVGFVGALWPFDIDDGLVLERAGTASSTFGLLTYTGAIIYIAGWASPTWLLLGVLAVGCVARAIQITLDRKRIRELAASIRDEK